MMFFPRRCGKKDVQHGGARRAEEIGAEEVLKNVALDKCPSPVRQFSVRSSPMPKASDIMLLLHCLSPPTLGRQ